MINFCGNCGAKQEPQVSVSLSGQTLGRVLMIWWKSPELTERIATFAVCGCGVHTNVKGQFLICSKCKAQGIRADGSSEPGEFPMMALYMKKEDLEPAGSHDVYRCLGAPMCYCRKNPCICDP